MTIVPQMPQALPVQKVRTALPVERVVIVSDFCDIQGGQAKVAIESARLLAQAGCKVTFFAATGTPDALLDHPDIRVVTLNHSPLSAGGFAAALRGLWNARAAQALTGVLAEITEPRAVLHVHGFAKALSPAIGPVLRKSRLPVVFTLHEYFLACPNGGFYDYQSQQICQRRPMGLSCLTAHCDKNLPSHKAYRVVRQALLHSLGGLPRNLRHIIYLADGQRRRMEPHLPTRAQLYHLPNPVGADNRAPVAASCNRGFVFVGRLSREKGATHFAEAAGAIGAPAAFIGDGPDADTVRKANPAAEVTGWLAPGEVRERIANARALVLPSLWIECQPLVMLEALSMGVPVVAGRWVSGTDLIEEGVSGILVDRPSVSAFADALGAVSALPDFDPATIRAACDPARHLEGLLKIYGDALISETG